MKKEWFGALLIALGISACGLFIYCGLKVFANKDRSVVVKGLSERDVVADFVVWPLEFTVSGNDLTDLYNRMSRIEQTTKAFFAAKGFKESDFSTGNISIDNNWESYYNTRPENHYTLRSSLIISTADVERVIATQGCQAELLNKGVILNSYSWNTDYQYNGLNELKPAMVEEATKNARAVAQKFADDAACRLGSIRSANQGQFTIESNDKQPWKKHVRVVTTVSYVLN